jgi:uncharacterized membrane protein
MPLYQIRRNVPGAGREDVDAAAFRALVCAIEFPGLEWVESYWDSGRGVITCIYEAESREQVEAHARRSRIACDEVREVEVIRPDDYVESTLGVTPEQVVNA